MVPEAVVAMLACARLGAVHSVVFGGFARNELATRIDDASPRWSFPPRAGSRSKSVMPYKPLLDGAHRAAPRTSPRLRHSAARAGARRTRGRAAIATGTKSWRRASRTSACRWPRPIRSTSSIPPAPPGSPRAWFATTAATLVALKWTMRTSMASSPARSTGPLPMSAGLSATRTSSTARCFHGSTTILYEGKPVGTPDAGAFWRVISQHKVTSVHRADGVPRHQARGSRRRARSRTTTSRGFRALFLAGERCDPDDVALGRRASQGPGDRPLVADRNGLADRRQLLGLGSPRSSPDRARRCRAGTSACSTTRARPPATTGTSCSGCRCRRARCRRSGTPTSASRLVPDDTPATTRPPMRASSTRTATSSS